MSGGRMPIQRGGLKNGSYVHRRSGHFGGFYEGCTVLRLIGSSNSHDVVGVNGSLRAAAYGGGFRQALVWRLKKSGS